jgi:hypothetical protein
MANTEGGLPGGEAFERRLDSHGSEEIVKEKMVRALTVASTGRVSVALCKAAGLCVLAQQV